MNGENEGNFPAKQTDASDPASTSLHVVRVPKLPIFPIATCPWMGPAGVISGSSPDITTSIASDIY